MEYTGFVLSDPQYCPTCAKVRNGEWHSLGPFTVPKYWKCSMCKTKVEMDDSL
jgi:hypothetical protein